MLNADDKIFLEQFDRHDRSLIANMFLEAVRNGIRLPAGIVDYVRLDAQRRLSNLARYGREDDHERERMTLLLSVLGTNGALGYARYSIAWEALPRAEREK